MTKANPKKLRSYVNRKLRILSQMAIYVDFADAQKVYAMQNEIQVDQWAHTLIVGA